MMQNLFSHKGEWLRIIKKRTMTIKVVLPFPLASCLVLPQLEHTCVHDVHSADTDTIQQQQHKT